MSPAKAVARDEAAPELVLTRDYPHPVERVFAAWTEAAAIARWIGPQGFTAPDTEFDARIGGAYVVPMVAPDGAVHTARGVVQDLVPNERLELTWAWDQNGGAPGQQTLLTLIFEQIEGGTRLTLRHANFSDQAARDQHKQGWTGSLDKLADYLGR